MKTAIVKTKFWDSQEFDQLYLDSKMVYFYLLTSPSRGLADIFYVNLKVAQAHTGLDITHIEKGIKQLIELGLVKNKDNYFKLLTDAVEPKKGRFTEDAIQRELNDIPDEIKYFFNENYTGKLPVHIDKDNNNNNIKIIIKTKPVKVINENAAKIANDFGNLIIENYPFAKIEPNKWAKDIEMINRIDKKPYELIDFIMRWSQNDSFWKQNIRSGSKLRSQFETLMIRAKSDSDKNNKRWIKI